MKIVTTEPAQTGTLLYLTRPGTKIMPLMSNTCEPFTAPRREPKAQDLSGTYTPKLSQSKGPVVQEDPVLKPFNPAPGPGQGAGFEWCLQNPVSSLSKESSSFPRSWCCVVGFYAHQAAALLATMKGRQSCDHLPEALCPPGDVALGADP